MGVDTKLFISSKWTHEEIKTVLEREFKTHVSFSSTHSPDYTIYHFTLWGDIKRGMSVFNDYEFNGFTGTLLSLGASGQAIEIMTALAQVFGGYLQPSDCDEDYRGFTGKLSDSDGLRFWSRYAVVRGIDPKSVQAFEIFVKKERQRLGIKDES